MYVLVDIPCRNYLIFCWQGELLGCDGFGLSLLMIDGGLEGL